MATGGQHIFSLLSEDFLSCEVCQEHFDANARTPRILPCHHTFCGSCLRQLGQDGHLTCPKCRVSIKVEASFPTDTTRVQLLDLVKTRDQEGQACQGCGIGAMAMTRCQECEEYLCADCTRAHQTVKITRSHKLEILSRAALPPAVQKATTPTKDPELCSQHQDEKLKWFCGKCTKTACSTCAMTMHKRCPNVVELSSIMDEKKKKVLALCEKLSGLGKIFRQKAEESEASSEAVDQRLQEGIQQAEQTFSDIVSTAMERQAEVILELRMAAKADRLSLEEESTTFRSLQAAAEASAEKGRQVVSLELAARIVEQECQMEKTAADLGQKTTATVKAASTYQVQAEQLDEVKTMIKKIRKKEAAAPVRKPSDRLPAERPKPPQVVRPSAQELPPRVSVPGRKSSDRLPAESPKPPPFMRPSVQEMPPKMSGYYSGIRAPPTQRRTGGGVLPVFPPPVRADAVPLFAPLGDDNPFISGPPLYGSPYFKSTSRVSSAPRTAAVTRANQEQKTIHAGVGCDGCQGPVVGTRYKCLQCPNYDLCESCEALQEHPFHSMLKLTRPARRTQAAVATLRETFVALRPPVAQPGDHKPHLSVGCDGCGARPVHGVLYKCLECHNYYDLCEDCEAHGKHPHHIMLKLVYPWAWKKVKAFMEAFWDADI